MGGGVPLPTPVSPAVTVVHRTAAAIMPGPLPSPVQASISGLISNIHMPRARSALAALRHVSTARITESHSHFIIMYSNYTRITPPG